ncbi:YqgQ family protein [Furfurilactobacillus sp. WILCCON 0119]|uniref:YqgQ family protein n=1 Tax=Furfurilactobacillus entadae TaxID=2922307 RepID=UPI0035EDCB69
MYRGEPASLRTLYDVQQLLKMFGIYVYVGKRLWDIEVMALELDNLYKMNTIDKPTWLQAKVVLNHEHHIEEQKPENSGQA